MSSALIVADAGILRGIGALRSIEGRYTGTPAARKMLSNRIQQWKLYRAGLMAQILGYAKVQAADLGIASPALPVVSTLEQKYQAVVPAPAQSVRGQLFQLSAHEPCRKYMKDRPEALQTIGLTAQQAGAMVNYVNGRRSISEIRNAVMGELNQDVPLESVVAYMELLNAVQWVVF